jgi:possible lipoprotein
MKKIYKVSLAAMTLLTLVACGPKRRPRTQPSTAQSEVTDGKSSKKASSGHEYYQTVLERYQAYSRAIEAGDSAGLETKLKEIDPQSDEYVYAMYLQTLGSKPNLSYFYTDLDKDGRDELLIGNGQTVSAIYYLKGQQPELLHTAFVASSGGSRSGFQIFEDGSVIYASFSSLQPEVDLIHYKFQKGKLETVNKIQIKNGDGQKPEKALGITAKELDQAKFGWKELETGKKATSQASTSEQQTNSYQVRVAVSDLRIRKEASIKGEEVGIIPQGVYTITETVTADGYTWGKLQSGQGWIALEFTTRVEGGNAESAPAPDTASTGMNLEEIKNGNFSSVAGVWKNKHGTSIEFNAQGIVKANGSALSGVQFSDFYFKEGNLHGLSRMPGATSETPIIFIPSREGGSESIYWSKNDVTNGNDLYYRVN